MHFVSRGLTSLTMYSGSVLLVTKTPHNLLGLQGVLKINGDVRGDDDGGDDDDVRRLNGVQRDSIPRGNARFLFQTPT